MLPEGPRLFDSEYMTDQTERVIAAELIREQVLHYTDQEMVTTALLLSSRLTSSATGIRTRLSSSAKTAR